MKSIEEIREIFKNDRYATESGCVIDEVGEHCAKCSVELKDMHKNAVGNIMGGIYFTLGDFAFAVATNSEDPGVVAVTSSISYELPAKVGSRMIAEAKPLKWGKTLVFYLVTITDESGKLLATLNVTGYRTGV